ncbi:hypothetical protein ACWPM1_08685 [Tsuneonella sp. HG249]
MSKTVYPIWFFLAVAGAIAVAALGAAQLKEGAGAIVAASCSLLWGAFVAREGAMRRARNG